MQSTCEYTSRDPEAPVFYRVVAEQLETFLTRQQERDRSVPRFVEFRSWNAASTGARRGLCTRRNERPAFHVPTPEPKGFAQELVSQSGRSEPPGIGRPHYCLLQRAHRAHAEGSRGHDEGEFSRFLR